MSLRKFTLEYWIDEGWYVGRLKEVPGVFSLGSGCYLKRHDIYVNPMNGRKAPVPRHAEIKESLCELIRRQLGFI